MLLSLFLSLTLAGCANSQPPCAENRPAAGGGLVQPGRRPNATPRPAPGGSLRLTDSGSGLSRRVTVESTGLFRLVFEAGDNWGLSQWYDLVNDPSAQTNLTGPGYGVSNDISTAEPGLFQQVFYGTHPDDPKLYTRSASHYFPNSPRSFNVLENSGSRVVVQASSSPMVNAVGVLSNVTAEVTYYIYPNGKIYVHSVLRVVAAQTAGEWRCATLGLSDPTSRDPYTNPDSMGWIRSTTTQNPYESVGAAERYIFAYWRASTTPAPYTNFTRASILLVPRPGNPIQGRQGRHNWRGWKRWYYATVSLNLAAGQSLAQDYLIQLGTQGSSVLPNINSSAVAGPIARAYVANPTPPSPTPTPTSTARPGLIVTQVSWAPTSSGKGQRFDFQCHDQESRNRRNSVRSDSSGKFLGLRHTGELKNWISPAFNPIDDSGRVSAPYPLCWSYSIFPYSKPRNRSPNLTRAVFEQRM